MEGISRVNELISEHERSIWGDDVNNKVTHLINECRDDEIEQTFEYNEYILEEMIEFINDVSINKGMMSINLVGSEFLQSYKQVIKFLTDNNKFIKEIGYSDEMLILSNNLFFHYSNGNFNSLKSYEDFLSNNIKKSCEEEGLNFVRMDFNDEFYDELKESLVNFIKILNNHYIMKKNSYK